MDNLNENYRRGFHEGMKRFGENMHSGPMGSYGRRAPGEDQPPNPPKFTMGKNLGRVPTGPGMVRFPDGGQAGVTGGTGGGINTGNPLSDFLANGILANFGAQAPFDPSIQFFDINGDGIIDGADLGLALTGMGATV